MTYRYSQHVTPVTHTSASAHTFTFVLTSHQSASSPFHSPTTFPPRLQQINFQTHGYGTIADYSNAAPPCLATDYALSPSRPHTQINNNYGAQNGGHA